MKKSGILLLTIILSLSPLILAVNLDVTTQNATNALILELKEKPAVFNLSIKNNGGNDNIFIYTYFSEYSPKEYFDIATGETKNIEFKLYPPENIARRGVIIVPYGIKGLDNSKYESNLSVEVYEISNVFEITSSEINPQSTSINVNFRNKVNFNFDQIDLDLSSSFFNSEQKFSLGPEQTKTITITLDKEKFKSLNAGSYTLLAKVNADGAKTDVQGTIIFKEKTIISSNDQTKGVIIQTQTISRTNQGNLPETVQVSIQKNIITRLFTSFNLEPNTVDRENGKVTYTWNKELQPGENLYVRARTNWIFPFFLAILIIVAIILIKKYTSTNVILKKKVTYVRAKGGEFALRISILVQAKKQVDNVLVIERIPPILKLYEKFISEEPARLDSQYNKLEWEFKRLEAGEKRMINYVAYSKVGVLGKFALPRTTAVYETDGKVRESSSNKVYFITEQRTDL